MSVDRLRELRALQTGVAPEQIRLHLPDPQVSPMGQFQAKADQVKLILDQVQTNTTTTKQLEQRYSTATTHHAEQDVSKQLDSIIQDNTQLHEKLDRLMKEMKEILHQDRQKTKEVMAQSQDQQTKFKESLKNRVRRQVQHLDNTLSPDRVEEICEHPEVLLQEKMYGKASIQLQNAVSDIKDKYKDIVRLERAVERVNALFQDLAMLTYQQGERVDRIEHLIGEAHDYVGKAEKSQVKAKEHQKAAQKKMCCIFVVVLVILVVILAPVLGTAL